MMAGVTCAKQVMIASESLARALSVASSERGASVTSRLACSRIARSSSTSGHVWSVISTLPVIGTPGMLLQKRAVADHRASTFDHPAHGAHIGNAHRRVAIHGDEVGRPPGLQAAYRVGDTQRLGGIARRGLDRLERAEADLGYQDFQLARQTVEGRQGHTRVRA